MDWDDVRYMGEDDVQVTDSVWLSKEDYEANLVHDEEMDNQVY